MSHVFISHSTADHAVAMEVCALLEARGTKCWIGPRDVVPGKLWDEAILDAIDSTSVFLLILSSAANNAPFVKNEVNRAFTLGKPILTFRVEDVQPGRSLELYLARHHWTDGFQGRIEDRVADLARALDALPGETGSPATTSSASASASSKSASFRPKLRTLTSRRERLAWGVAAVCALGALAVSIHAGLRAGGRPHAGLSAPVFSTLDAPAGTVLVPVLDHGVALSPDGRRVVFVAKPVAADRQLYLRELAEMTATVLPETVGASYPFWSPDGTQIGFFAGGKLKVVDASGGAPRILADAPNGRGGSWGQGGLIVYAPDIRSGLRVVAAVGGAPRDITRPDAGHTHRWPVVLPDGRHLLFRSSGSGSAELMLGSLDGTAPRPLIADSTNALYVHPGFILFGRGNDLFAWRFDARSLQLSGVPRSLAVGKADMFEPRGFIAFSASDSGALIFVPRDHIDRETEFRWVGRDGRPLGRVGRTDRHRWPRLSPDGERIVSVVGAYYGDADVRVTELRDQREIRLSGKARTFISPVWSADSRTVLVGCGGDGLCRRSLDDGVDFRSFRSGGLFLLTAPSDVSSDGRTLLFWEQSLQTGADLRRLDLSDGGKKVEDVVREPGIQLSGAISPDGRWVAYTSDETGSYKLYVRSMSGAEGRWTVWDRPAHRPRWTKGGRELLFVGSEGDVMSVAVADGPVFRASEPKVLFTLPERPDQVLPVFEDATRDGERLLLNVPTTPISSYGFRLVLGWPALLGSTEGG